MIPVIDPAPILELRSMLDDETVRDIADEFRQSTPPLVARLDALLAAGDLVACQVDAHGLKSAASSLGLRRFAQSCFEMEMACREGRPLPEVRALLPAVKADLPGALLALDEAGV